LSGGERQRVAIARALATGARLLLMDEPLAALDAARKAEVLPYLERLHRELQLPVVYVTHAMDEATRLADHLVMLDAGRVRAAGPVAEVMARPDLPLTRREDAGVVLNARVTPATRWGTAYACAYWPVMSAWPAHHRPAPASPTSCTPRWRRSPTTPIRHWPWCACASDRRPWWHG
jgi:ABC-type molybdate transport system ATPase subunit